jgi:sulfur carrier protein ThiS
MCSSSLRIGSPETETAFLYRVYGSVRVDKEIENVKRPSILLGTAAAAVIILPTTMLAIAKARIGTTEHKTVAQAAASRDAAAVPGVAAVVNDQTIPMSQVSDVALRVQGASILDQLIGETLIHQEAKRRNEVATSAQIDARVQSIRLMVEPHSLDDSLRLRHMTMAQFREEMQSGIEVRTLLAGQLKPVKMTHVRDIFVNISPFAGMVANLHTAAQAERIMAKAQKKVRDGEPFDEVAQELGDPNIEGKDGGDLGIVSNFPNVDQNAIARGFSGQPEFLKACLSVKSGQFVGPLRTRFGLHFIQGLSTGNDPLPSEVSLYANAREDAIEDQLTRLAPQFVESLKRAGTVKVYLGTGKPGPAGVAADVNGELIPTSHVVDIALATVGPMVAERLIGNALVDQEAINRHIMVTPGQIDAKIDELREQAKPRTLYDLLRQGHTTMAELRETQKVKIETEEMIAGNLRHFRAAHIRDISITIKHDVHMTVGHSEAEARSMMANLLTRLKSGAKFEDIARQYSEDLGTKASGGDMGIVTEKDFYEPALLSAAIALKKGQFTMVPVKTSSELHLLQAVSTSADHPATEDSLYARAQQNAKNREIQSQVPGFLRSIRSNNRVVNYLANQ